MKPLLKISCKKATEMLEHQSVVQLSFWENLKLKFHLIVCKTCCSYHEQTQAIDMFFKQNTAVSSNEKEHKENNSASSIKLKNKIIKNLNDL